MQRFGLPVFVVSYVLVAYLIDGRIHIADTIVITMVMVAFMTIVIRSANRSRPDD